MGCHSASAYKGDMPVQTMLLWTDDVQVEFGIRDLTTDADWRHDVVLRAKAQTTVHEILQRHKAHAGEGWKVTVGGDGEASAKRLW